jgi:hypothetical protein
MNTLAALCRHKPVALCLSKLPSEGTAPTAMELMMLSMMGNQVRGALASLAHSLHPAPFRHAVSRVRFPKH